MAVTQQTVDQFHDFATARVAQTCPDTMEDIFAEWSDRTNRAIANEAIAESIEDVKFGRLNDSGETISKLRSRLKDMNQ